MKDYDFTLKFNLPDSQVDPNEYVEKLYENGCDDALIGVGDQGYIGLNFMREAASVDEAISSAIADVKRVLPDATMIEATTDSVRLTDKAEILRCIR
jgi:ribosomal protein S5